MKCSKCGAQCNDNLAFCLECGNPLQLMADFNLIEKELANRGVTIVVIEHIMMFIKEICDRVAVLHAGSLIAEGVPSEVALNEKVIHAYLGGRKL